MGTIKGPFCNLFAEENEDTSLHDLVDFIALFVAPLFALSFMSQRIGTKLWIKEREVTPIIRRKRKVLQKSETRLTATHC